MFALVVLTAVGSLYAGEVDYSWAEPGVNVLADEIYIKVRPQYAPLVIKDYAGAPLTGIPSLDALTAQYAVSVIEKVYYVPQWVKSNPWADDMDLWYSVHFEPVYHVAEVRQAFETCSELEYVEWNVINKLLYRPNDPQERIQWHIEHCRFWDAWDVSHGSSSVVIGIVDSGIDMNAAGSNSRVMHEDLARNIWQNPGEDINHDGICDLDDFNQRDDDDNGYADDFHGWDFEMNDNWPDDWWGERNGHGTHVAGIASAVTDNDTGVAGAAFSARLMIAACYSRQSDSLIAHGEQGIFYCGTNRADVINLSWGSDSPYNQFEDETIQYAVNQGCKIFAGSGNDNVRDYVGRERHFYPAAFNNVIGVSGCNRDDNKCSFATYGDYVDLVTPGEDIVSTFPRNSYAMLAGTSMASPLAAGLGALLLSVEPDLTTAELLQKMQQSAVDISARNANYPGIRYRIDAGELLARTHPYFEMLDWSLEEIEGDRDDYPETGEEFAFNISLQNRPYYAAAQNVAYRLTNPDHSLTIQYPSGSVGDVPGGQRFSIENNPPAVSIHWSQPHYSVFTLCLTTEQGWTQTIEIPQTINHPYYLFVDDDGGDGYERYYEADLDVEPRVHDSFSMEEERWPPEIGWMCQYNVVIWMTGNARNALNEDELATFIAYLRTGGKLILIGQYLGEDYAGSDFFTNYLHVRHLGDSDGGPEVYGIPGDPITDGRNLFLIGGAAAGNNRSPSTCEALEGARPIYRYYESGATAGTYFGNDTYQCIYLGFAFEAASGLGNSVPRHEFLAAALDNLFPVAVSEDPTVIPPSDFSLSSAYPNPFNASTRIMVAAPVTVSYTLDVRDPQGRLVETLHSGLAMAGTHSYRWNAAGKPTGEYFFQLTWEQGSLTQKAVLLK